MFSGEYMGAEFIKRINEESPKPKYKGKVIQAIKDALDFYRNINPEAL